MVLGNQVVPRVGAVCLCIDRKPHRRLLNDLNHPVGYEAVAEIRDKNNIVRRNYALEVFYDGGLKLLVYVIVVKVVYFEYLLVQVTVDVSLFYNGRAVVPVKKLHPDVGLEVGHNETLFGVVVAQQRDNLNVVTQAGDVICYGKSPPHKNLVSEILIDDKMRL